MTIDTIKHKKECSAFYKIGYKTAYRDILSFLNIRCNEIEKEEIKNIIIRLIEEAKNHYASYPGNEILDKER